MISLKQFINNTKGQKIALPNGKHKGQCVSLVQQYLIQCFNIPFKARGNAKDFGDSLVHEGYAIQTNKCEYGDLIVYEATILNFWCGHIAIYISDNKMYDQNNGYHDNYKSGYTKIFKGNKKYYKIITKQKVGKYKLNIAKAIRTKTKMGHQYIVKVKDCYYDIREDLTSTNENDDAYYRANAVVNITEIIEDSEGRIWGKLRNCYIVLVNKDGKPQATYIGD